MLDRFNHINRPDAHKTPDTPRDYAYNRSLFLRVSHGFYLLSPSLELRIREGEGEIWRSVASLLNLSLVREFTLEHYKPALDLYQRAAGVPSGPELRDECTESIDRGAQATRVEAPRKEGKVRENENLPNELDSPGEP